MENRIKAVFEGEKESRIIDIFGYTSRGIPGVEILGLGQHGRTIKEKLIFLSRICQIKFPAIRFVLCVDLKEKVKSNSQLTQLELPLLCLFWSLSGLLPIKKLDNCICNGSFHVDGTLVSANCTENLVISDKLTNFIIHQEDTALLSSIPPSQLFSGFESIKVLENNT